MPVTQKMGRLLAEAPEKTADARYKEVVAQVDKVMGEVHKLLAAHAKEQAQKPKNWGFVGDMESVRDNLQDIRNFLAGEG